MRYRMLLLCFLLCSIFPAKADEQAPYIYYYSFQDNAFLVERADGTETRVFGQDLLLEAPIKIGGPGWSPNGQRYAFNIFPSGNPNGFILDIASSKSQPLQAMWRVHRMDWSPDSAFLLVAGNIDSCQGYCSEQANWLIDVAQNNLRATFDVRLGQSSPGRTPLEWDAENGQVIFYSFEENLFPTPLSGYSKITMRFDGTVTKSPISSNKYRELFVRVDIPDMSFNRVYSSSSGRYKVSTNGQLTDIQTQSAAQLPMPDFGFDGSVHVVDVRWDDSEEWALVGYNVWSSGVDGMSIMKSDGSDYRQLTTCGDTPACIGWLPSTVDLSHLEKKEE